MMKRSNGKTRNELRPVTAFELAALGPDMLVTNNLDLSKLMMLMGPLASLKCAQEMRVALVQKFEHKRLSDVPFSDWQSLLWGIITF